MLRRIGVFSLTAAKSKLSNLSTPALSSTQANFPRSLLNVDLTKTSFFTSKRNYSESHAIPTELFVADLQDDLNSQKEEITRLIEEQARLKQKITACKSEREKATQNIVTIKSEHPRVNFDDITQNAECSLEIFKAINQIHHEEHAISKNVRLENTYAKELVPIELELAEVEKKATALTGKIQEAKTQKDINIVCAKRF